MKWIRQIFSALLLAGALSACGGNTPSDADNSLVYKISKTGAPDSYLIGTIHAAQPAYKLPEHFSAALQRSSALVVETESADPEWIHRHPEVAAQIMQKMTDTRPLSESLGTARIQRLGEVLQQYRPNALLLPQSPLKPQMLPMLVTLQLLPPAYSVENGIDVRLMQAARQTGKPIIGLESWETGIALFEQLPEDAVKRSLDLFLQNHAEQAEELQNLLSAYERQDVPQLRMLLSEESGLKFLPAADHKLWRDWQHQLLDERNRQWMQKLPEILNRQSSTVAVGSAHLFGKQGLIALLREQGFTVQAFEP